MEFQESIKKLARQNLTQEDFAKEIGVSFATVNRREIGKAKPNLRAMKRIDTYCADNNIDFDVNKELVENEE